MPAEYLELISKYSRGENPLTVPAFIIHSALVTKKALDIARDYARRNPDAPIDLEFLEEIGMLHDIGIFRTRTPALFTQGRGGYITHLTHGKDILESEGLPRHARAAKNHAAIKREDIEEHSLELPSEEHMPESAEEEILFLADLFYSKVFRSLFRELTIDEVREYLGKYGEEHIEYFDRLWEKYCGDGTA